MHIVNQERDQNMIIIIVLSVSQWYTDTNPIVYIVYKERDKDMIILIVTAVSQWWSLRYNQLNPHLSADRWHSPAALQRLVRLPIKTIIRPPVDRRQERVFLHHLRHQPAALLLSHLPAHPPVVSSSEEERELIVRQNKHLLLRDSLNNWKCEQVWVCYELYGCCCLREQAW